jgi:uncharacterized protein YuzE
MLNPNVKYDYDSESDILYISINANKPSYGEDIYNGIVARYDMVTDELNGYTIFDYKKRIINKDTDLLKIHVSIDYDNDAIPFIT